MATKMAEREQLNNEKMAQNLVAVAELLEGQDANPYRVQAYRTAAETLRGLEEPAANKLRREGRKGLIALPGIGESIAATIEVMVHTGRLPILERLRGVIEPEQVLATVPGIGPKLADRIHEQLGIETLLELQAATYDGRLDQVEGMGVNRVRGVRESLAGRLDRNRPRRTVRRRPPQHQPPVAELLDVDAEYRRRARAGDLPRIAPRRYNPTNEAWLPILHTERGDAHYTALFSNSARAHELNMIRDWVVIYRDDVVKSDEKDGSGQWTVITSQFGPLKGKRIVRGREEDTADYYEQGPIAA